jgi:hypothetical protein
MANSHRTSQFEHMPGVKHIAHQSIVLAQVHPFRIAREYPCRVLSAMLEHGEPVVNGLVHGPRAENTDYPTHGLLTPEHVNDIDENPPGIGYL